MNENKELQYRSPKRWLMVVCIGLMHACLMGSLTVVGAYSGTFMGEMGATQGEFVQLTMIGFLTGALFSIPMGILADKFGVTKIMGIGMFLSLCFAVARIFMTSFWGVYICCFGMGLGLAGMNANSVKFLRAWFGIRQVTTAMTLYVSGAGIGVTACMALASVIQDVNQMFVVTGIIYLVATVVWFAFARMPKNAVFEKDEYSMKAVKSVLGNKLLLAVSLAMVLSMCASAAYSGNVPSGLIGKGLDPVTAAVWASFINLVGMPSNWIMGPLADKIGRIKPVLCIGVFVGNALLIAGWAMPLSGATLPLIIIGCFVSWGNVALIKGCVGLIPSIKPEYMGTAGGIQTFFQNLAAFIIPSFIITPLCGGNMVMFFVCLSVCVIAGGVVMLVTPELGAKGKIHQQLADQGDSDTLSTAA